VTPARAAGLLVGLALVVAGAAKRVSPAWPAQARDLGAPGWAVPLLPWVELALGACLVVGLGHPWAPLGAAALLAVFTGAVVRALAGGRRPPCACFGALSARPIGARTVVRNLVLIALALVALGAT
jgi:hypothetical protein